MTCTAQGPRSVTASKSSSVAGSSRGFSWMLGSLQCEAGKQAYPCNAMWSDSTGPGGLSGMSRGEGGWPRKRTDIL